MPASKPYSIYAGGYSQEKKAKLDATKLPDKLLCKQCKKLKTSDCYSQRQLGEFKQRLARNPRLANESIASVTCRTCTGGQVTELECTQCNQIKALEGFTKAQRRDPDFARCILCVNHDLKTPTAGPNDNDDNENVDEDYDDDDGVTNRYANTTSEAGTGKPSTSIEHAMAKASINIDSDDSDDNPFAPQKSRAQQKKQAQEKSKAATTFIGYDASGRAFRRSQTPSVAATTTSRGTIAPRSNFARVKADHDPKNPKGLIGETPEAKAVGRQVYRPEDSDSDDYGYI